MWRGFISHLRTSATMPLQSKACSHFVCKWQSQSSPLKSMWWSLFFFPCHPSPANQLFPSFGTVTKFIAGGTNIVIKNDLECNVLHRNCV